jgi:CubicO group peptidase (beta-lactamase class C family)
MNYYLKCTFLFAFFLSAQAIVAQRSTVRGIPEVDNFINEKIQHKKIAGAVVMIKKGNSILHYKASGYQDIDAKIKMDEKSIFRIYSMTKPLTSVALMILKEQNLLKLDDQVSKYIPEFKNLKTLSKPKSMKGMTIRDLLRHTAGFSYGYFTNTGVDKLYNKNHPLHVASNKKFIDRTAELPLLNQPGEKHHYSIATDVLGVLIERVSKMSLGDFFKTNIFRPLGMKDTDFMLPESKINRFCSSYKPNLQLKDNYLKSFFVGKNAYRRESGGGGLLSTASDYMKFCSMLKNKGIYNGNMILKETSVIEMTKNQLKEGDFVHKGIGFGLGFSVQLEEWGNYGHIGDYGWSGAASTHFYISPTKDLIVIILSQIQPFSNQLQLGLKPLIFKAVDEENKKK